MMCLWAHFAPLLFTQLVALLLLLCSQQFSSLRNSSIPDQPGTFALQQLTMHQVISCLPDSVHGAHVEGSYQLFWSNHIVLLLKTGNMSRKKLFPQSVFKH